MSDYRPPRRSIRETPYLNHAFDGGINPYDRSADICAQASRELKERSEKVIFKFGFRHGITTDEARHLLLNTGIKLSKVHKSEKDALVTSSKLTQ